MSPATLVVVGGGEHAAVVADAARTCPDLWRVAGYLAPEASPRLAALMPAVAHLGDDDAWTAVSAALGGGAQLILGFGGATRPGGRAATVTRFGPDATWATVVHAAAAVSPSAQLGSGVYIGPAAVVGPGASLGDHAIVNSGAIVEHDVVVGPYAHVAPGAVIGGGARIGSGAFIGLGASVCDHVTVGDGAVVAMGAAVVRDVPPHATVAGVPARERRGGEEADRG